MSSRLPGFSTYRALSALGAFLLASLVASACSSPERRPFDDGPPDSDEGFAGQLDAGAPEGGGYKCVSEEVKGQPVPLSILVLLDRSGSMTTEMWSSATNAIRAFADRSEVVGMQMGLSFFPPAGSTTTSECNAGTYANPAVPIAILPDNVIPIQQKLAATSPGGGTPMTPALGGSITAMQTWLSKNDPHAGAVILVTDGDPSGCSSTVASVASTAASGANASGTTPPVRTFVVGMQGATFSNLDQIAAAGGGAPTAFNVGSGPAAQQALLDALETVRTGSLGCEYILPVPKPEDGTLDLDSVDIKFTPGENDPTVTIRRVENKEACGATTGGFYYDDPKNPSRVVLCPASCGSVRGASAQAKVDIVLGCVQRPN